MSSFKGFSAEELASLEPWKLPVMGEPEEECPVVVVEEETDYPAMPTAEEIEAMQKQAYEEARAAGFKEGSEQGYRDGREEGYRQGYNEGRVNAASLAQRLQELIDCLSEPLAEVGDRVEQELVALAIAVAKQLIRRELKTEPGEIIAVVREAMAILPSSARKIALHLHPDDAELIRSTLALDELGPRWKVVEDPLLTRGGCRVTTDTSYIDATVEKRLASTIARLFGGERDEDRS
ncbi:MULTISPECIES: flagellar assembly protein FliH [unclassified Methylocaldum]|jgi:flagellar assembly protein FliH|uniref:flagellar assembly protein FliH n=1 Tax=unclassified Methylocaldum TaxID=2622260 RepID=UPI000A323359|nr:flagellar assembly protein FliH [Methylocaldum sp. RMAD-M]MBP1150435.1 flagellar assembly protein FliH [Methylocaldum sp. RMAD-M]